MQKIIDGKLYDTDKSLQIHTVEFPPYEAFDPAGDDAILSETHTLYLSGKGQFFVIVTTSFTNYPCDKKDGQLLSMAEARNWLEENDAPADAYEYARFKIEKG